MQIVAAVVVYENLVFEFSPIQRFRFGFEPLVDVGLKYCIFSAGNRGKPIPKELRVNRLIHVPRVFVIDEEGHQLGQMSTRDALEKAQARNLDLVEVNPTARPPVCRFMDYGKYKYTQSKSERGSRAKRKPQEMREIQVKPKIEDHDFDWKVKAIDRFLRAGDRVRVLLRFRGREIVHTDLAKELLRDIFQSVQEVAIIAQKPTMDGRRMVMVLAPKTGAQASAKPKAPAAPQASPAKSVAQSQTEPTEAVKEQDVAAKASDTAGDSQVSEEK